MYNRYSPQSDGSYQKSWVPDQTPPPRPQRPQRPPAQSPPPEPPPQPPEPEPQPPCPLPTHKGVGNGFLSQLLPRDFDTGDLLVMLLLLLIAGDGKENRSTALLTLALYFIL